MIHLAWRQFRVEAGIALVALAVVAVVLGVTGPHLVNVYSHDPNQVGSTDAALKVAVVALLLVAPAMLGVFFGPPLVARELETGTFRLAWTQSVSRSKWLLVKFALVGLAASVMAGGLSLMAAWWANPINLVDRNRFSPGLFGLFGTVPFGYALFAFAVGAVAGVLLQRTLPAMLVTLVAYVAARAAVTYWVRPHFASPLHRSVPLTQAALGFLRTPSGRITMSALPPAMPNAWPLSASIVDKAGRAPSSQYIRRVCPTLLGGPGQSAGGVHTKVAPTGGVQACVAHLAARYHAVVAYQPASRYWSFQLYETALFVVAAVALAAAGVWWARRRLV